MFDAIDMFNALVLGVLIGQWPMIDGKLEKRVSLVLCSIIVAFLVYRVITGARS